MLLSLESMYSLLRIHPRLNIQFLAGCSASEYENSSGKDTGRFLILENSASYVSNFAPGGI